MRIAPRTALTILLASLAAKLVPISHAQALDKLPEAASDQARIWAAVFDFDTDSCYPSPAIFPSGDFNPGLSVTGVDTSFVAGCRDAQQLDNSNTYHRAAAIRKGGNLYVVHMYALYFMKDKDFPLQQAEGLGGHRHDWEYALVWLKNGVLTHASYSAHGGVTTSPRSELAFDAVAGSHVKVVYHKNSISTHSMRFAAADETAENHQRRWLTPTIVDWRAMRSATLSNAALREKLNAHSFGEANCSVNDHVFPIEISQSPPAGYPSADEWKRAALRIPVEFLNKWAGAPAQ